jgi:mannose-6-phosphate isomerase
MYVFEPIYKKLIWGGKAIGLFKGLDLPEEGIGESWEVSHVEGDCSVVALGNDRGKTMDELIRLYGEELTGEGRLQGGRFPLLIKFIDAREDLSIQVHPNDRLARHRHGGFGKTEMWYVVKADKGAAVYTGFSRPVGPEEYLRLVNEKKLTEVLQRYEVTEGDVFFLPAGRIHAIGAGCFMAEIQQTGNLTYRIYDYDRKSPDGHPRELHTELAKDAIDFSFLPDYRTHYTPPVEHVIPLVHCSYFTTNLLAGKHTVLRRTEGSFRIYICIAGAALVRNDRKEEILLKQGQTLLVPAVTSKISITPSPVTKLLETYIS